MVLNFSKIWKWTINCGIACFVVFNLLGCNKIKSILNKQSANKHSSQTAGISGKGGTVLNPKLAAEITHEVSMQSMAEFPTSQELPKDPKKLVAINKKIREKAEKFCTAFC